MKELQINISLSEVHTEVRKITGYIASKAAQDGTLYQQMSVQRENGEVIGSYIREGLNNISEVFYIYLYGYGINGDMETGELNYFLRMPSNWPDLENELKDGIENFLIHQSVSRWMESTEPGEMKTNAKVYLERSVSDLDLLRKLCNRRVRPEKPYVYLRKKEEGEGS